MINVGTCTAFRVVAGCCSRLFSCGWQFSADEDVSDVTVASVCHKGYGLENISSFIIVCEQVEDVVNYVFDLLVEWVEGESYWDAFVGILFICRD